MTAQAQQLKFVIESRFGIFKQENGLKVSGSTKRDRIEIIAEILLFCYQQKAKTNIMHKTNLSYAQLQHNLTYLMASGMLTREESRYITTEEGYRFLELFAELQGILRGQKS